MELCHKEKIAISHRLLLPEAEEIEDEVGDTCHLEFKINPRATGLIWCYLISIEVLAALGAKLKSMEIVRGSSPQDQVKI